MPKPTPKTEPFDYETWRLSGRPARQCRSTKINAEGRLELVPRRVPATLRAQVNTHQQQPATVWVEFVVTGPVEATRYRTSPDASVVQFWSEHAVPGLARRGWNTTRSATVAVLARKELKARA